MRRDAAEVFAKIELIIEAEGMVDRYARIIPIQSRGVPVYASSSGTSNSDNERLG